MSEVPEDADLRTEQIQLLLRSDDISRQLRELITQRDLIQRRLDDIAAERRGRAHARQEAAKPTPATEAAKPPSY